MIDDRAAVATLLNGGALGGRRVSVVSLAPNDGVVLVVPCAADEVLTAWRAARAVVEQTGRWPVVVTDWMANEIGPDVFTRVPYERGGAVDRTPGAVCARALEVDVDAVLAARRDLLDGLRWGDWRTRIGYECEVTERRYGIAPTVDEVVAALGDDCGSLTLDHWLFEWEERAEASGVVPIPPTTWHQNWFEPPGQPCGVALLPTEHGWQAPAWVSFFGADNIGGHAELVAVLRRWYDQWGAELVASWGTMLQFVVACPPTDAVTAYPLALAHDLVAGSTLGPSGVSVREHARVLVNRRTWFLHDRP